MACGESCRSRALSDPTRGVIWIGISVILFCYPATDAPLRCWGVALQQDGQAPPLVAVGSNDHHVRVLRAVENAQGRVWLEVIAVLPEMGNIPQIEFLPWSGGDVQLVTA